MTRGANTVVDAAVLSRLYLLVTDATRVEPSQLTAAIAAGDVASVLLRLPAGEAVDLAALASLVRAAQLQDVAVLIENDIEAAKATGADGVHIGAGESAAADVARARARLGKTALIGVSSPLSRHEAMVLGELGVDYVAFAAETPEDEADRLDLIDWWCEVIEIPAVAFAVRSPEDAGALAKLGCEFIGVEIASGDDAAVVRDRIATFQRAISRHPVAAE